MAYQDLAHAIVIEAAHEWLERKRNHQKVGHLTKWFKSEWCDMLLTGTNLTGEDILKQLRIHAFLDGVI